MKILILIIIGEKKLMMKIKEPVVILNLTVAEAEWLLVNVSSQIDWGIDNTHPASTIRDKLITKD